MTRVGQEEDVATMVSNIEKQHYSWHLILQKARFMKPDSRSNFTMFHLTKHLKDSFAQGQNNRGFLG